MHTAATAARAVAGRGLTARIVLVQEPCDFQRPSPHCARRDDDQRATQPSGQGAGAPKRRDVAIICRGGRRACRPCVIARGGCVCMRARRFGCWITDRRSVRKEPARPARPLPRPSNTTDWCYVVRCLAMRRDAHTHPPIAQLRRRTRSTSPTTSTPRRPWRLPSSISFRHVRLAVRVWYCGRWCMPHRRASCDLVSSCAFSSLHWSRWCGRPAPQHRRASRSTRRVACAGESDGRQAARLHRRPVCGRDF
jgi:hypothetical protein